MNSYISILGLYNYDPTIFSDMQLPPGVNADLAVTEILLRNADLEILYPDAVFMKAMIAHWSAAHLYEFQKLYETMNLTYNPIWNKDGVITEESETSGTDGGTIAVKGYNSDSWADASKTDNASKGSVKTRRTEQGNIGVTTTQQMIKEEREIAAFNIYSYIADSFRYEFCIQVY